MRIINFNGQVDEASCIVAIIKLLNFDSENSEEPIYIHINSPGGEIVSGLALYDTIKYIKAPVYTICTGLAASMGSFLLSCGEKGHRAAFKHSRILIHQPLIYSQTGSAQSESELRKMADGIKKSRDILETIMAENSNQPIEKFHADCERDNWMTAQEALEYGLIDEIIE